MNDNDRRFIYYEPNPIAWLMKHIETTRVDYQIRLEKNPNTPWKWLKKRIDSFGNDTDYIHDKWGSNPNLKWEYIKELLETKSKSNAYSRRLRTLLLDQLCQSPNVPLEFLGTYLTHYSYTSNGFVLSHNPNVFINPNILFDDHRNTTKKSIKSILENFHIDDRVNGELPTIIIACIKNPNTPWNSIKMIDLIGCKDQICDKKFLSQEKVPYSFIEDLLLDLVDQQDPIFDNLCYNPNIPLKIIEIDLIKNDQQRHFGNLGVNPNVSWKKIFIPHKPLKNNLSSHDLLALRSEWSVVPSRKNKTKIRPVEEPQRDFDFTTFARNKWGEYEKNSSLPFFVIKREFYNGRIDTKLVLGNDFLYNDYTRRKRMREKRKKRCRITGCSFSNWY